jgi:hypothetical protein
MHFIERRGSAPDTGETAQKRSAYAALAADHSPEGSGFEPEWVFGETRKFLADIGGAELGLPYRKISPGLRSQRRTIRVHHAP